MIVKSFLKVIIFTSAFFFALPAHAAPVPAAEAKVWVQDKGLKILDAFGEKDISKKHQVLDEMFLNYIDLDYISKFVIGKYWRQMTSEQKKQYQALFKRYALAVYKSFPLSFENKIKFDVAGAAEEKDYTNVVVNIKLPSNQEGVNNNILVTFRLDKTGSRIKITDIKLAEASLILSYRSRFYQMVMDADEDMGWFLEDFETAIVSTEKQNQENLELAN